jgi:hypothetical protein
MENPNIRQTDIAGDKLKYFPIFFYERVTKTIMAEQILPKHEEMKNAPQLLDLSSYLTLPTLQWRILK